MERKVSIRLQVTYFNELSPIETSPELLLYLDSGFNRRPVKKNCHDNQGNPIKHEVTVTGTLSSRRDIPLASYLVLRASCNTPNEFGYLDRVAAGTVVLDLRALYREGIDAKVPLTMASVHNLEKGQVHITCRKEDIDLGGLRWESNTNDKVRSNQAVEAERQMEAYLETLIKQEDDLPELIAGTENIRCPFYYGDVGMRMTQVPLPAFAFTMAEVPTTNLAFWDNATDVVLARNRMSSLPIHDLDEMARIGAEIVMFYVQNLDYKGDDVDENRRGSQYVASAHHSAEKFGDALRDGDGDCEDEGQAGNQMLNALIQFHFPANHRLQQIQQIMSQYVPFCTLDAVTAGQVSNAGEMEVGAHLNLMMLPMPLAKRAMEPKVAKRLPWHSELDMAAELPVLTGEGTGMLSPLGHPDVAREARAYILMSARSLDGFKKPIIPERNGKSNFYLGILNGFTSYFIDQGGDIGSFIFSEGEKPVRGMSYQKLEEADEDIRLLAHDPIPPVVMQRVREVIKTRVPPKQLLLTKEGRRRHPVSNKYLDMVSQTVREWKRKPQGGGFAYPCDVYVRPHQLSDRAVVAMLRDFKALDRVYKVDYKLESITDELYGYRVLIYA